MANDTKVAAHTAGPWRALTEWEDGAEVVDARGYEVASLNTGCIAINRDWLDAHQDGPHWAQGGEASHIERDEEEIEANARLIAAAPDLMHALDTLLAIVTDLHAPDGSPDPEVEAAKSEARAAIAKATGAES